MAAENDTAGRPPGKPIVDVEPVSVEVLPEYVANGVRLEVVDRDGDGFRTILDLDVALDVTMRAIARLRGWKAP